MKFNNMESEKSEVTNVSIITWYFKGLNDEKNGTSTVESDNEIENEAYSVGANDAMVFYHVISEAEIIEKVNLQIQKNKDGN